MAKISDNFKRKKIPPTGYSLNVISKGLTCSKTECVGVCVCVNESERQDNSVDYKQATFFFQTIYNTSSD